MSSRKITFDVRPPNIGNECQLYDGAVGTRIIQDVITQDIISEIKDYIPENEYNLLSDSISTDISRLNTPIRFNDMMEEYFEPTPITMFAMMKNELMQSLECDTLYLTMNDDSSIFLFKFVWMSNGSILDSWDSAYLLCVYLRVQPPIQSQLIRRRQQVADSPYSIDTYVIKRVSSFTYSSESKRTTGQVSASDVMEEWFGTEQIFTTKPKLLTSSSLRTLNFSRGGVL